MQIPTFQPRDIKINFSMLPPPFLQNFTSRHYHYLIPRHNHRASIIITRNRRAHSFYPEHNDINQPQKRFHAELSGNERNVLFFSSTFSIFPLSLSFSPSFFFSPPFFRTILAFTRPCPRSSLRTRNGGTPELSQIFYGRRRGPRGKFARGKPVYIHGHVEAAKRGKIVKVYLVCHRDDYHVVVVSLRRSPPFFFPLFLSLSFCLSCPLFSLYERDALSNEFFRSSVIATMFNFSISLFCPFWNFNQIGRDYMRLLFGRRRRGRGIILSIFTFRQKRLYE